jgi:hypothetical protein
LRALTFSAVLQDGKLELQPGFVVDGEPSQEKGELTVEALGQDGGTLARTELLIETPCGDRDGETAQAVCGLIAFPEKATGLRVSREDDVLFEQSAPADDLEVKVEWPGSLSATETVHWRGSADECIASLGYSNDGGETWTAIALPGPSNAIDVDASALPGGGDCLLELIVTDGFHTRRIRSDAYQVSPKGWALWILSPAAGASLPAEQPVLLAAQGFHFEERRAGFDDIEWESSGTGDLGTGARLLAMLEPGEHTIVARMYGTTAEVNVSVG